MSMTKKDFEALARELSPNLAGKNGKNGGTGKRATAHLKRRPALDDAPEVYDTPRGWLVYAWVPVNVKVKAKSAASAEELALNALTSHGLSAANWDGDDSAPIYLDDGLPCKIDDKNPCALLETDGDEERPRVYAREEAA